MIDMHAHILPNIDDGSKSIDETYELIKEAKNAGFTDIITTSHYLEGYYETTADVRKKLIECVQKKIDEENYDIKLHNGAEIYIMMNIPELIGKSIVPTLAKSRYVLFEIPLNSKILYLDKVVDDLLNMNLIPIMAHPERCEMIQKDLSIVSKLIDKGVLFQMNYGSVIGIYGKKVQDTAIQLLFYNMIQFFGSDVHRENTIYVRMPEILDKLKSIIGSKKIKELTEINPRKVLNNEKIEIEEPISIENSFIEKGRFKIEKIFWNRWNKKNCKH